MKVLVTGGAGFIGSAVCRLFVGELGVSVLSVDKLTYAANLHSLRAIENHPNYAFRQADICDRPTIARIVAEFAPDAVLHLAAESHVDRSIDGPGEFIKTNIDGTFALLDAARGYWEKLPRERAARFRFHHVSTDEVFGALPLPPPPDRWGFRPPRQPRQIPRDEPLQAEFALRRVEGRLRPSGARLARDLWPPGGDEQLLEQLR